LRITLILAAAEHDPLRKTDPFMPLSLPLLAASAPGHEYAFVDMLAGERIDFDRPTDLVGISARMTAEKTAFEIAAQFRRRGVKVAIGGPQISINPRKAAAHADAVAVGEGELLWPVIVRDAGAGELKRYYVASPEPFDGGGESVHRIPRFADLSTEVARAERRPYRKKYAFDTVFATRGCAINCDFCSVPSLFGAKVRTRPAADVVAEIDTFRGMFYLLDDTVFGRPQTYGYYLDLYERLAALPGRRPWTGQANLDAAATDEGREVIRRAARAGLTYAAIGVESIDPRVLERTGMIRKMGVGSGEDAVERMKEHVRFIQEQGIFVSTWFVVGNEEDTLATFENDLAFAEELRALPVVCPLEALPGTRLHARLEADGRLATDKRINIRHPAMTDEQILGAMQSVNARAFSARAIFRRSFFNTSFYGREAPNAGARIREKMQKTMFTIMLQFHMRKGVIGLANDFR
jgi:radical SAM superfamily enzyme YgiQ (UPF0313 family)